nr:MAG TPA: hypothetical protein [Caudoviricetes sp.]
MYPLSNAYLTDIISLILYRVKTDKVYYLAKH